MISQKTLNKLTNIDLKDEFQKPQPLFKQLVIDGKSQLIPIFTRQAIVVGSGAAGLRCALELHLQKIQCLIVTSCLFGGTSACSGSDKQTIFTASTCGHGDDVLKTAAAIASGGAMHGDLAYIEACGSYLSLDTLRSLGLEVPEDKFGAVLRYKTDHDEAGRATSCGPRTSRMMVKVLSDELIKLGAELIDNLTVIKIISHKDKVSGAIGISPDFVNDDNIYGLCLLNTTSLVLAGGGAGELYRDSVYPYGCVGCVGIAAESGLRLDNLPEEQFGISTDRNVFAWNLSGTYMQAMPRIYSQDPSGNVFNFLDGYYRSTAETASNIFLKGYQWPVHAERMLNFGSSLIDLAIYREKLKGRKVFLDFRVNPVSDKYENFCLNKLNSEVIDYLSKAQAMLQTPLQRLEKMNPLSITLYQNNGVDLRNAPLEVNINHQHFNGGIGINAWGQTSLEGCYAIGESAGSHGVTRPGGSALNSGQVFARRAAQHISNNINENHDEDIVFEQEIIQCFSYCKLCLGHSAIDLNTALSELKSLMSNCAGFICSQQNLSIALEKISDLKETAQKKGLNPNNNRFLRKCFEVKALLSEAEALIVSLLEYIKAGGGSRGARVIIDEQSSICPSSSGEDLSAFKIKLENIEKRQEIVSVQKNSQGKFAVTFSKVRPIPDVSGIFFEKDWESFLNKTIYK